MIRRSSILNAIDNLNHRTLSLLIILVLTCSVLPSFGQNYTLSGKITELERVTGAAQKEVRVDVDSSKFIAFTNADGTYSIPGIPAGTHNIRVSKPGFVGFFKKDYNLDGDKAFDVCLADTIQESPNGTQVLKVADYELLHVTSGDTDIPPWSNGSTWNHVTEGNLIPVLLLNATHLDSLAFRNAIGACNGNWQDSPDGSVERGQKRPLFILSNDPLISYTKRGIRVDFDASSTNTIILANEQTINYIFKVQVNLRSNGIETIQKELFGRSFAKADVFNRLSYMNSTSAGVTDLDHMLNIVFFNQWVAIYRSEQDANIFDMEKTPTFAVPSATNILSPVNNASGLEKNVRIQYNNIFGTDKYRLQISDREDFSTILKDLNVMRTDTTIVFDPHTTYYARVQAQNSKGISPWSEKVMFSTKNLLPAIPVTDSPANGQTLSAANYQNGLLILKYTTTAKDGDNDNVTTTLIVTGANVNKTFNSTQDGQVTQTLDSLLLQPGQTYTTAISATDGTETVNGTGTTFIVPKLTAIEDPVYKSLKVGPIPVTYTLNIEYDPNAWGVRRLFSLEGKLMEYKEIDGQPEQIDLTKYKPGLYMLEVSYGRSSKSVVIIKQAPGRD